MKRIMLKFTAMLLGLLLGLSIFGLTTHADTLTVSVGHVGDLGELCDEGVGFGETRPTGLADVASPPVVQIDLIPFMMPCLMRFIR